MSDSQWRGVLRHARDGSESDPPSGRGWATAVIVWTLLEILVLPATIAAQTLGGQVLDSASRKPIARASVAAFRVGGDSVAAATTDSGGVFYLDVPSPGKYRLKFRMFDRPPLMSDTVVVQADEFVERRYVLAVPKSPVYFEFQVEKQVAQKPGTRARYPESLRSQNISGHVLAQFVVDAEGTVELQSIRILRSTDPEFTQSVLAYLRSVRYKPAEIGGRGVRQLVQQPFNFCLTGAPPGAPPCNQFP